MNLEIAWSARKHGVADEDIEHAVICAMSISDQKTIYACTSGPPATLN